MRGGGSRAEAPQTHTVGSTFPEEIHIHAPTNVLLSSSGNKQNERESFRSVEVFLQDFILQIITVQPTGYKFIYSSRTAMGPVSAISVLILGIVVPTLAGYIEVSNTTFPDLFQARLNLHEV